MSLNPEIQRICSKLNSKNKKIAPKADYFLRKLNRKTRGSMGSADMLKYLICIDLAHRDLGLEWDVSIANKLGLKSKQYNVTFNRIQSKLNIQRNKAISFQELSDKHFQCNHVRLQFTKTHKKYTSLKINALPIVQRKYCDVSTPAHRAAIFYVVATKVGKV